MSARPFEIVEKLADCGVILLEQDDCVSRHENALMRPPLDRLLPSIPRVDRPLPG
jgi:hypothetical protein